MTGRCPFRSRRGFLGATAGFAAALGASVGMAGPGAAAGAAAGDDVVPQAKGITPAGRGAGRRLVEPFYGAHQGGIETATQNHTYFAAFDLTTDKAAELARLLRLWTDAAAAMAAGAAPDARVGPAGVAMDSGESLGLAPSRLTVTFGFGAGLFVADGRDRYGLGGKRPAALIDMPVFHGDQLVPERSGGDLSVQACADDPQVAFHAVRHLARLARDVARLRWTQTGFTSNFAADDTPRNLMGFKDGTQNPAAIHPREKAASAQRGRAASQPDPDDFEHVVWAGDEGPAWMRGGSYAVVRRIRIALEHWDNTELSFQEETVGRRKASGAPIGGRSEFDAPDLDAADRDGNPLIPDNAHVRLASAAANGGAQILRRAYTYNDGTNVTAERWPPWHNGLEYDAGLFFICYQKDPRTGFVKIFDRMAKIDAMNQYTTHTGGGLFACPGGIEEGAFVGQGLFDAV